MGEEQHALGSLVLTVSYDGSRFSGFARQPGCDTVQGHLESALCTILRRDVETVGAGRTDAGVHARGQVVSFESLGTEPELSALMRSLNALVGDGIVVTQIRRSHPRFSARFDAEAREYRYRLVPGPIRPLFLAPVAWWTKHTLDLEAMREAAAPLVGEHDFRSFCVSESARGRNTRRSIEMVRIVPEEHLGEHSLNIRVVGNSFLHSMVRIIVGSLVEVGSGRRKPEWMAAALAARDRAAAGPTAPPHGLTLWYVWYPEGCWL